MASDSSKTAVMAAIGANSVITIAKFIGFGLTGSGSMLGEAIHTSADLLNQILLLIGIKLSGRPPSAQHPYGYSAESFVWALISAVGIFFLGCGVTVYHGIHVLLHPEPIEFSKIAIGILIASFMIDGAVLMVAAKGVMKESGDRGFWDYVTTDAEPTTVAVLLEDSVASVGVIIALTGMGLSIVTKNPMFDAIGTLAIGVLLGFVAVYLVYRNREFLIGRAAPEDMIEEFVKILEARPAINQVFDVKSRLYAADIIRFKAEVDFNGRVLAQKQLDFLKDEHEKIGDWDQFEAFAETYAERICQGIGREIDEIEAEVREAIPEARHVDIESDLGVPGGRTAKRVPTKIAY